MTISDLSGLDTIVVNERFLDRRIESISLNTEKALYEKLDTTLFICIKGTMFPEHL